jgi:SAM-dependent methyltransferase
MKDSWTLPDSVPQHHRYYLLSDREEIDHPDSRDRVRLHYLDRLEQVFAAIRELHPEAAGIRIADLGCAQGNLALRLAEAGYRVWALDHNSAATSYAAAKHERGEIQFLTCNIEQAPLPAACFDVAVLAEVIEHTPQPEHLLEQALRLVRSGGHLVVSTPNGARLAVPLPTLAELRNPALREKLAPQKFGDDHLWKLLPEEAPGLLPREAAELLSQRYCGSTILVNRFTQPLLRLLPLSAVRGLIGACRRTPLLNRKTFNTLCLVFRKTI